jgi:hypothetical protein
MTEQSWLELLEGTEVISTHFEGCVMVKDGQIWQRGEIIRESISDEELKILGDEAFYQEFGSREQAARALEEEFGPPIVGPLCSECEAGEIYAPAVLKVQHPNENYPNLRVTKWICEHHLTMLGDDWGDDCKVTEDLR